MSRLVIKILLVTAVLCSNTNAEDVIWNHPPSGMQIPVSNKVVIGPGPPGALQADYLLPQVLVDAKTGNPGIIDEITTFFVDDAAIPFETFSGNARINIFEVAGPTNLPTPAENPDDGIIVPATFIQQPAKGWIEVRVTNLAALPLPIEIIPGVRYDIGLTPILVAGGEPFGGFHICNTFPKGMESQSAFRTTSPILDDWFFAGDLFGPPELFATTVIEPLRLGDVNCDGLINLLDVAPFVDILSSGGYSTKADIDGDGAVTALDIDPFIAILSGI